MFVVMILWGTIVLLFRHRVARGAKRQNEAIWGGTYSERGYLYGFTVAGGRSASFS